LDAVYPATGTVNRFQHAFYLVNGGLADLGTLGGSNSFGTSVRGGHVVGSSFIAGEIATHGLLWKASTNSVTALGTLPSGFNSQALGITRNTVIAGSSDSSDGTTHAVICASNNNQDLGSLGGSVTQATAINEPNVPAGFGFVAGDAEAHAWVGKLQDIGTLGVSFATANAINEDGVVVGSSNTAGDADVHAFVWTRHTV
jgi:probable HAF family extracellular repeat protein